MRKLTFCSTTCLVGTLALAAFAARAELDYQDNKNQFKQVDLTPLNVFTDELTDELIPEVLYSRRVRFDRLNVEVFSLITPLVQKTTYAKDAPAVAFTAPALSFEQETFILIIEGGVSITVGTQTFDLKKHDLVRLPTGMTGGVWHAKQYARGVAISHPSAMASLFRPATDAERKEPKASGIEVVNIDDKSRYRNVNLGVDAALLQGQEVSVEIYRIDGTVRSFITPLDVHREEELAVILKGYGYLWVAGKENRFDDGTVLVLPSHIPHRGHYTSDEVLMFSVYSPKLPPAGGAPGEERERYYREQEEKKKATRQ